MEKTLKDRLDLAIAKLNAGALKLKHLKAYKIKSLEDDFEEFCKCSADIFDACDSIEAIRDECAEALCGKEDAQMRADIESKKGGEL